MFNQSSANRRHKNLAEATIRLVGEEPFEGAVYLSVGDRLIDLLNDERAFIPVRREDGRTVIVAKAHIVSIVETSGPEAQHEPESEDIPYQDDSDADDAAEATADHSGSGRARSSHGFDAYAFLKISPDATVEEIRSAYKKRIKAVHPDSIASLGLDDELAAAALKTTQKLNYAYRKIMRDRESDAEGDQRASA